MISDAVIYEDNQGIAGIPHDSPIGLEPSIAKSLTEEEKSKWSKDYELARRGRVRKRKQRRILSLYTSLNRLSASFIAVITVVERQVAILLDLQSLFLTTYRTKTKGSEKGYPSRENPFYKNIAPIPTPSENSEQILLNTLDAIDEVVRERKCFIEKIKALVEIMEIKREIV